MPVVSPQAVPPLFTWEVFPHLYPTLPPPRPTAFSPRTRTTLLALFVAATATLAGTGLFLSIAGAESLSPGPFVVVGVVYGNSNGSGSHPVIGASVTARGESGPSVTTTTNASGDFRCAGLSAGLVNLSVSAPGYLTEVVLIFISTLFSSAGTDAAPVSIHLAPVLHHGPPPVAVLNETPFASLADFVASLWSSAALLGVGAFFAGVGGWAAARDRRPAFGVTGGLASLLTGASLGAFGVTLAFPLLWIAVGISAGLGLLLTAAFALRLAWEAERDPPD